MKKIWQKYKNRKYDGYSPVGESVDWQTAMSQAVTALDHAAHLSIKTRSPSGMREVAVGWLAVAESISKAMAQGEELEEEVDLDSSDNNEVYPIGFRPNPEEECEEEYEEEE